MRNTVLILGAGASADFGIPLWGELREQLNTLNIVDFLGEITDLTEDEKKAHTEAFSEYLDWSKRRPDYTLDRTVYEIDKNKDQHLHPTGHLVINIVGYLIAKLENQISDGGWVTEFQNYLVEFVADASRSLKPSSAVDLLQNLTVVSLNYDRIFENFIAVDFFQKLIEHDAYQPTDLRQSKELATKTELKLYRPHGYICSLPNGHHNRGVGMGNTLGVTVSDDSGIRYTGNSTRVPFGDVNLLSKTNFLHMGKNMYVVDERGETDYANANGALKQAKDIFCLGLSPDGILQSSLIFNEGRNVYLSNNQDDFNKVSELKPGPNYKMLSNDGTRLDAKDFTRKFIKISQSSPS